MAESTKMTIFGESIHHNQNHSLPSIFREPFNEIHRNICPYPGRYGKGLKQSRKGCCFTLIVLAGITFNNHWETYLCCFTYEEQHLWEKWLPLAEWWYNTSYHTTSQMTPYEAVYGHTPLVLLPSTPSNSPVQGVDIVL